MLRTRKLAIAAAAGLLLALTACSSQGGAQDEPGASGGGGAAGADTPRYTVAMVTHEQPGTTFWDRVRAGAEDAAAIFNIDLRYSNDPSAQNQATLVQNAIDSGPDGIAATLAAPEAVGPTLAKAPEADIPTVAFNAGIDVYQDYGALMFFGSDEQVAGESAGARIAEAGGTKALCVIHAQGVVSLETRCAGVAASFPNTENIQVDAEDLPSVQATITAKLGQDPAITDIVTLDAGIAEAAVAAKASAGSQARISTFDLSPEVVQAIQGGDIEFSVDQQPYLQGFLAVESIWLQMTNGNDIGGGQPVLTGPSFVDASNIEQIATFAENNTR